MTNGGTTTTEESPRAPEPRFVFKNTITLGSILNFLAWTFLLVAGWTRMGDRLQVVVEEQAEAKRTQILIVQTLSIVQQANATDTAVLSEIEKRLKRDEDELYDGGRRK